jgi:hypothetical protein
MGGSPLPPLPDPGPSEDHFPSPLGFPANPDTLSTVRQTTPPQSLTGGPRLLPLLHSGPSPPGWSVNSGTLLSTGHQSTPPQSPTGGFPLPPLPHLGSSEDRSPSPHCWLAEPDALSSTGSQPTLPQSPAVTRPPPSPDSGPLDRRVFGPGIERQNQTSHLL